MRWIALHLGRRVARLVLWPITGYFLCFGATARRASRAYLTRALGRPAGWRDVGRHLFSFAATILDRIYLLNDRFDLFRIEIEGEAMMRQRYDAGHGALLFGAHLGSFELTRALGRQLPDQRIALTMYEENARKINATLEAINPAARPEIIPLGRVDTMLQVRDALEAGALVGLLADRSLGDEPTRRLPLLGDPAALPVGPFRMAAMLRQPVIFMAGLYLGGNRYRIRFVPIADFGECAPAQREAAIDAAMARYAAELERCCREAPLNWFNFFDFWSARPQ
ncbi:acyl-CoA synthetase [Nitrogeniibacter mangrovi]|uniref:Acyl-CoA synthetase n=2 Tax=Nitrogeniibacter mangrovi TaxID=2016596 RepID=A0A6C1BBM2_9RHOO|nr:acyl-CoA synthetase [Nitrogeniibacter mangrovi]